MIVVNGVKNWRASLTETISRSFEKRGGSQAKHRQDWPHRAPFLGRPLYSIHGSQHLLLERNYPIMCTFGPFCHCSNMRAVGSGVSATVWGHGNDSKRPVTHRDTHLKMSSNFSRFFFPPFPSACFPSPLPPSTPPSSFFVPHLSCHRERIDRPLPKVIFNGR